MKYKLWSYQAYVPVNITLAMPEDADDEHAVDVFASTWDFGHEVTEQISLNELVESPGWEPGDQTGNVSAISGLDEDDLANVMHDCPAPYVVDAGGHIVGRGL